MRLKIISTKTPVGDFHMIAENDVVVVSGFGSFLKLKARLPKEMRVAEFEKAKANHPYVKIVTRYFDGDFDALDGISRRREGSLFNKKVRQAMSKVKAGATISYKTLAKKIGKPKAFRAIGTVCGQNRLILLVPCHRVVKSDGSIGDYLYGQKTKQYLLKMEDRLRGIDK